MSIALRNMRRNPLYTGINLLGLSIGIACFILIALFIQDELSYDQYHSQSDRIYRLVEKIDLEGQGEESSSNPFPTGPALQNDYPQLIEEVVRLFDNQVEKQTLGIVGTDKKFSEESVFFADSNLFRVFDFPLALGNGETALAGPNKIILGQEIASKYFGSAEAAMGKQLMYDGNIQLVVSGVLGEIPSQSHFQMRALISFPTLRGLGEGFRRTMDRNWVWNPNWTYILLAEDIGPAELEREFPRFVEKYYPDFMKKQITHYLQALGDIHLTSRLDYEIEQNSSEANLYIFAAIALFILLIACINFMNLATARSANRAREVGVRKTVGADRWQLIRQFLGESILTSLFAGLLAFVWVEALMPLFNTLSGKSLDSGLLLSFEFAGSLLLLGVIVGIVAGVYPAFFLSAFKPSAVLKGHARSGATGRVFRQGLVVLQFVISLVLIISTATIFRQYLFMQDAALGFQKDQVVVIPTKPVMVPRMEVFKNGLLGHTQIQQVTTMNEVLGVHHNVHEYNYEGMAEGEWQYYPSLLVDEDFVETFDLEIIAGRDFDKAFPRDDSLSVIVNEAMVRHMNWGSPEDALNQRFKTVTGQERIVGVVKDFNIVSLKEQIRPFVLDITHPRAQLFFTKNVAVRMEAGDPAEALAHMESVWQEVAPEHPFEYSFLSTQIDQLYQAENRLGDLIAYFSILAILIACSGLFALATYTAEQRTREIGIRKVLGASGSTIIRILATDFLLLILVAIPIAWFVAWISLDSWLQRFAFRTDTGLWVYLASAIGLLLLALLTVIFQTAKASQTDPAIALRSE